VIDLEHPAVGEKPASETLSVLVPSVPVPVISALGNLAKQEDRSRASYIRRVLAAHVRECGVGPASL
jgi:hypothetical protein